MQTTRFSCNAQQPQTHRDWCIKYHEELLWGRDITRNIYLIETGWQIIRFWNFEIKDDMSQCLELIQSLI